MIIICLFNVWLFFISKYRLSFYWFLLLKKNHVCTLIVNSCNSSNQLSFEELLNLKKKLHNIPASFHGHQSIQCCKYIFFVICLQNYVSTIIHGINHCWWINKNQLSYQVAVLWWALLNIYAYMCVYMYTHTCVYFIYVHLHRAFLYQIFCETNVMNFSH